MCLCVLSERAADGECCGPQEHQSGRDLGLPGAGCPHRWCKRTPDFLDPAVFQFCLTSSTCLQPVNGSTVEMLPVTYDFSSLNLHCERNQLANLNDTKYILKLGLCICSFSCQHSDSQILSLCPKPAVPFSSPRSPALWRWAMLFVSCLQKIEQQCPGSAFVLFQRLCAVGLTLVVSASHRSTGMKTMTSSHFWEKMVLKTQIWTVTTTPVRSFGCFCLLFSSHQLRICRIGDAYCFLRVYL